MYGIWPVKTHSNYPQSMSLRKPDPTWNSSGNYNSMGVIQEYTFGCQCHMPERTEICIRQTASCSDSFKKDTGLINILPIRSMCSTLKAIFQLRPTLSNNDAEESSWPMGPSMRETTVILLSRRTIRARNGYEFSFSAWDTATHKSFTLIHSPGANQSIY